MYLDLYIYFYVYAYVCACVCVLLVLLRLFSICACLVSYPVAEDRPPPPPTHLLAAQSPIHPTPLPCTSGSPWSFSLFFSFALPLFLLSTRPAALRIALLNTLHARSHTHTHTQAQERLEVAHTASDLPPAFLVMWSFYDWAMEWINTPTNFKGSSARSLIEAAPDYPLYSVLLYLAVVFFLPELIEKRGWTFHIKYLVASWNLTVSLVSVIGTYYCAQHLLDTLMAETGFHKLCCSPLSTHHSGKQWGKSTRNDYYNPSPDGAFDPSNIHKHNARITSFPYELMDNRYDGPHSFYMALFMYLKTPELLDTLFLVLQRKPVSFLHWYHHIVTAIYCWHASYVLIPSGMAFCTMNYFVHSIMYFYYFLVVMGLRKWIRPFAPVITLLQVLQMFIGMYITMYTYFQYWLSPEHSDTPFFKFFEVVFSNAYYAYCNAKSIVTTGTLASQVPTFDMSDRFWGCDGDPTCMRLGMLMYGSYCVLFAVLFKELYLDKRVHERSLVVARKVQKARASAS
ncbi:fatty acid elongase, putative [Leishmania tarentolae]|uniref:Elongation of fatty acids protein n=1 Tax=Leishmania tarentolae TaxID=5689 RepID=A0A640KCG1_LEITA|nr:fatty acid elongase, putative [Leishmania tarentolae]